MLEFITMDLDFNMSERKLGIGQSAMKLLFHQKNIFFNPISI